MARPKKNAEAEPMATETPKAGNGAGEEQNAFAERYNLKKLHPMSNLFVGVRHIENIPARQFVIEATSDFQKAGLKDFLHGIKQANIAIRNFPSTVDELRKRLKIKDGGNVYLFATTLADNTHRLIRCSKG